MNTKATFLRLFAIATVVAISFTACKKTTATDAPKPDNTVITINGRTANPAQSARITITQEQLGKLKSGISLKAQRTADGGFTALPGGGQTETGFSSSNTSVFQPGPGDCPPISRETLAYYQNQANECCCSFAVCLQGANCDFYFYYFSPNKPCTGGNEM